MQIRERYFPAYNNSEEKLVKLMIDWIEKPLIYKVIIKFWRNIKISIISYLKKYYLIDRSYKPINNWNWSLPIFLSRQEVLSALKKEYKDRSGIEITFEKNFKKTLSSKEQELIKQEQRKILKEENGYLLDIIFKLEKTI